MKNLAGAIWIVVGTRPEVIKQAMLYKALLAEGAAAALIGTGQHRELLEQALHPFDLTLDVNLDLMGSADNLTDLSAAILTRAQAILREQKPRLIVVQGDTLSAAMLAWAGFLNGIPVAHNEAGLRTFDLKHPFPEEGNRRLITAVAKWHFPPTERARRVLLDEGVNEENINLTGNPGIDAMMAMLKHERPVRVGELLTEARTQNKKIVLLTAHRRENEGEPVKQWFCALDAFLRGHPDLMIVYPMHPNNVARPLAQEVFQDHPQMKLLFPPLDYPETCHLLRECAFVVTDSGGIQEEASTLGVPVVVCRETSERMEAVELGQARLAGLTLDGIFSAMEWAYDFKGDRKLKAIFGDGKSAERMARAIVRRLENEK